MTPTIREIQEAVAARWGVTVLDMTSRRRLKVDIQPRHAAMWLARRLTEHSMTGIGRAFGGRDHATVINGVARIDIALRFDPRLRRALLELADQVGGDLPELVQPRLELVA